MWISAIERAASDAIVGVAATVSWSGATVGTTGASFETGNAVPSQSETKAAARSPIGNATLTLMTGIRVFTVKRRIGVRRYGDKLHPKTRAPTRADSIRRESASRLQDEAIGQRS
ncbi:MAG: hypothetical protein DME23_20170 [Verrucomicrobia bacterium]|nr:MAG: hypothetical protein DME23_20170 [Verrucomicrobiota bacterium]